MLRFSRSWKLPSFNNAKTAPSSTVSSPQPAQPDDMEYMHSSSSNMADLRRSSESLPPVISTRSVNSRPSVEESEHRTSSQTQGGGGDAGVKKRRSALWVWKRVSLRSMKRSDSNEYAQSQGAIPPVPPVPAVQQRYTMPRNALERERLDRRHLMLRELLQTNIPIPIPNKDAIRHVLDIGAGSGIWCIDIAQEFPGASVTGCDTSSVYPSSATLQSCGGRIPSNCRFLLADANYGFSFLPSSSFDFIHLRFMFPRFPTHRYPALFKDMYRLASENGGIACVIETDFQQHRTGPCASLVNHWAHAYFLLHNLDPGILDSLAPTLMDAGFTDVLTKTMDLGCGAWAGKVGEIAFRELKEWLEVEVRPVVEAKGWTDYEWADFCERWAEEVEERRTFWRVRIVWGSRGMAHYGGEYGGLYGSAALDSVIAAASR